MPKLSQEIVDRYPAIESESILIGWRGSVSHGTYIPGKDTIDDKDIMAVVVPSESYYYGLDKFGRHNNGTVEIMVGEWDVVCYELRKMVSLLIKGNPNVLSLLWLPDTLYISSTEEGRMLLENREMFVSKEVYYSFVGYAKSQFHKMEAFKKASDCGEKRKRLIDRFGYDTKNASHLIRLLRMGIEFLTSGELIVQRMDAVELLDIKNGKWTLDDAKEESRRLFALAEEAYVRSPIPNKVDYTKINKLCVEIVSSRLNR